MVLVVVLECLGSFGLFWLWFYLILDDYFIDLKAETSFLYMIPWWILSSYEVAHQSPPPICCCSTSPLWYCRTQCGSTSDIVPPTKLLTKRMTWWNCVIFLHSTLVFGLIGGIIRNNVALRVCRSSLVDSSRFRSKMLIEDAANVPDRY